MNMKKLFKNSIVALCIAILLMASGCGTTIQKKSATTQTKKQVTLTISAAASLKDSMDEIKSLYEKENPNTKVNINYGSSGALQTQIEQGANVDIFMSAAAKQMDALSQKKLLLEDTRINLLGNSVVLIVKSDSSAGVSDFKDATTDKIKKLALGEPKSVPAGQYAEAIYTKLNMLDKAKAKAVYGKDVKEVLNWVETGNADAGVVYKTDALTSKKAKIVATADNDAYGISVVYPEAVVKASKNVDEAKKFIKFTTNSKAVTIYNKYGFQFIAKSK